jgi:hypothetical protein
MFSFLNFSRPCGTDAVIVLKRLLSPCSTSTRLPNSSSNQFLSTECFGILRSTFTLSAWHFAFTIPPRSGETEQSADSAQKQYAAANTAAGYLEEGRAIMNAFPHRESYKGARDLCSDVNEALSKDGNSTDNYASMD